MYVDVVRKWVLWDFLHFGVLSHTEKDTTWAYQPKLAVLGLSTASIYFKIDFGFLNHFV